MEQGGQVRVAGPSRVLLAASTGALVAATSAATAVVVLSGTAGVVPGPLLEPRPPAAAAPGHPPVVVLPPGALGTGVPMLAGGSRPGRASEAAAASPRRASGTSLVLSLAPQLPSPALAPAGGLLPPRAERPLAQPPRAERPVAQPPLADVAPARPRDAVRPGARRGGRPDAPVLAAPLEGDATQDAPSDSLSGTRSRLLSPSEDERRQFVAQERGRRVAAVVPSLPLAPPAAVPATPAVPAVPAVPGVSPAVPASPASPAAVERRGPGPAATTGAARGTTGSTTKTSPAKKKASPGKKKASPAKTKASPEKKKASPEKKKASPAKTKKKASGSSSGRRAPQGSAGSGRGPRS